MTRFNGRAIVIGVLLLLIVVVAAWLSFHKAPAEAEAPAASALVSVTAVRSAQVDQTVEAYGVIAGSPAATREVSTPHDLIVEQLLVGPGQPVAAGAALMIVGDTPASALAYRNADAAVTFAKLDLARVQRLYGQQLAASDQLAAAQKAAADAQAALSAQSAAGAGRARQTITSPITGIVWQVAAVKGRQLTAGAPLVTLVPDGGLVAQLSVDPVKAAQLTIGQSVRILSTVDAKRGIDSRLSVVGQAVDPTTRLISVTAPADGLGLALGAAVRGEIIVARSQGLTVPRASVVYDENGAHIFVVRGGKAHQVAVTPGPEQGEQIAISGDIHAADQVAVKGAYQLLDGMAVRIAAQ